MNRYKSLATLEKSLTVANSVTLLFMQQISSFANLSCAEIVLNHKQKYVDNPMFILLPNEDQKVLTEKSMPKEPHAVPYISENLKKSVCFIEDFVASWPERHNVVISKNKDINVDA